MDTEKKLIEIVAQYRNVPEEEIDPSTPLRDMGLDSLDIAELLQIIEDELHVIVEPSPNLDNIVSLADYIDKQNKE